MDLRRRRAKRYETLSEQGMGELRHVAELTPPFRRQAVCKLSSRPVGTLAATPVSRPPSTKRP
jgi:hypothetical protein